MKGIYSLKMGVVWGVIGCMGFVKVSLAAENNACNERGLSYTQQTQIKSMVQDAKDLAEIQGIKAASKTFMTSMFIQEDLYIFVIDHRHYSLANGGRADFAGKNLKSIPDARESAQNIIEKARQGGGWVSYIWKSPKKDSLQCKTSWVTPFLKDSKSKLIYTIGAGMEH